MTFAAFLLALLIVSQVQEARARGEDCDNGHAPDYTRVICDIIADESGCSSVEYLETGRSYINRNCSSDCLVSAGLELYVTCCNDELVLFRNGQNLSSHTVSWTFATSLESGMYDCRWRNNGTSFTNRSVVVDGTVYVIPGAPFFNQDCKRRIAGDFNCSVAQGHKFYRVIDGYALHDIQFNVLGARPISLSLEMIWVDHYPVELNLSLSSGTALNNTISHTATVESLNLVFVGSVSTRAYLVVTGTTSYRSSSMCVSIIFSGDAILLPNESLPAHLAVVEGQRADFHCDAHTTQLTIPGFTVSFLVKLPSSNFAQCSNYTFSRSQSLIMNSVVKDRSCSGLAFKESYSGDSHLQDRTNHLTASWPSVNLSMSGAEVVCAQASSGITQWARTATLTVLPASFTSAMVPPVSPTVAMPLDPPGISKLSSLAALPVLLVGGVILLVILLRWRYKRQTVTNSNRLKLEQMHLTSPSLPSSSCTSPTIPNFQFFPSSTINQDQLLQKADELNLFPSSYQVCVYVSYSNSQADWVQGTLLPLLHSFQPIRVTDHEAHMIPGGVVSEERLRLLQSADKVVAVIAPDYQLTEWCNYELQHVLQQSSTGGAGLLIPILCGGCRELPSTISTLHPLSLEDPNWTHKLRIALRRKHPATNSV